MDPSLHHYKHLLSYTNDIRAFLRERLSGILHPTALTFDDTLNARCYEAMYLAQRNVRSVLPRRTVQTQVDGLRPACKACMPFFLKRRSRLRKASDVITGVRFEEPFIRFLAERGFNAIAANEEDLRLPDIAVKDAHGRTFLLMELKYHNAPFIRARRFLGKKTECYDGSLTIDREKFLKQRTITRELHPGARFIVVHWVDFPCLKCILWADASTIPAAEEYERRHRSGDYRGRTKVGYTRKVYHRVRYMNDLAALLQVIRIHTTRANSRTPLP